MKLRTTVFLWVIVLVLAVLGAAIGTIAVVFDRSTRSRLAEEAARNREVVMDLHQERTRLARQECRVVAEEPRLKAVVATEDVARETILDAVRTLSQTVDAGVFVIVDAQGALIADGAAPEAEGFDLMDRVVVKDALTAEAGEQVGVWLADDKAYLVAGCRLEFGARVVGALVIGHAIDDAFAQTASKHTDGAVVVAIDRKPITLMPPDTSEAEIAGAIDRVRAGEREVTLGDEAWFAQLVPIPGYQGEHAAEYLLVRSIDQALAPARRVIRFLLFIVGAAALATLIFAFGLARGLARPIDALVARTKAIAGGDLGAKPVAGPTEVKALGAAMDAMAKEIDEGRAALLDKDRLAREMEIAARIQTSILPRNLVVDRLDIAAKMLTATEVGGDYYDVIAVPGGCWIAVGDASGHGLTAGLVMMMVQSGLGTLVRATPDASPKDLVRALNTVMYENIHDRLETERHMTLSLMRYRTDGTFVVAGAHMDAVVWRAKTRTTELLPTVGTFLAITEDIDHVNQETTWALEDGDVLVLLTDGVTEAEGADGTAFDYAGVRRIVEARATEPVVAIRDGVFSALRKHSPALADDATMLVLRYGAPSGKQTT
ncbi:MAG: PP2C family protein-serine/threonine phosphatase [Kofleriaceae bacterium]